MYGTNSNPPPQPSYPPWQQPAPKPQGPSHAQLQPPASTGTYNPNTYGVMPGPTAGSAFDTSSWGVHYNQQQQHSQPQGYPPLQGTQQVGQAPPPLPPRPASVIGLGRLHSPPPIPPVQTQPQWQPQLQTTMPYYPQAPGSAMSAGYTATSQSWQPQPPNSTAFQNTASDIPPPPPPLPLDYQLELQQNDFAWSTAPVYSGNPPSHNYEPTHSQQQPQPQQQYQLQQPQQTAPSQPQNQLLNQSQPQVQQYQPPLPQIPQQQPIPQPQQQQQLQQQTQLQPQPQIQTQPQPQPQQQQPQPYQQDQQQVLLSPITGPNSGGNFDNFAAQEHTISTNLQNHPLPESDLLQQPLSATNPAPSVPVLTPSPAKLSTSPIANPDVVTGASALGAGGPSDWEHFGGEQEDGDVTSLAGEQKPQTIAEAIELPSDTAASNAQAVPQTPTSVPIKPLPPNIQEVSPIVSSAQISRPQPSQHPARFTAPGNSPISSDNNKKNPATIDEHLESRPKLSAPIDLPVVESKPSVPKPPYDNESRASTPQSQIRDIQQQKASPSARSSTGGAVQSVITISDPYEDLDPWYKSSLTRYVTMLRKEMETESENEKYRIFTSFMHKESKLRAILYNIEESPEVPYTAKPTVVDKEITRPVKNDSESVTNIIPVPTYHAAQEDFVSHSSSARPSSSDGNTMVSNSDGLHRSNSSPHSAPKQRHRGHTSIASVSGAGFSQLMPNNAWADVPRSVSVPPVAAGEPQKAGPPNLAALPPTTVYTPFRYSEAPRKASVAVNSNVNRPAYQGYSALRQASVESGRVMAFPTLQSAIPSSLGVSAPRAEHDETFLGLVRAKSIGYRGHRPLTSLSHRSATADPFKKVNLFTVYLEELRDLIPNPLPKLDSKSRIAEIREELDNFSNDFNFIQKSHEAWDNSANARQEQVNKQRKARQEESEQHIDALFNDKEIGYSDIHVLEDEFKQTEAQKQLNEERKEFDKYVEIVYSRVDGRLTAESKQLQSLFDETIVLLKSGNAEQAGPPSVNKPNKFELSHIMKNAVSAFNMLEKRHGKTVDAVLERERRRKKAERRYYVFLGDTGALKQMERDFAALEQKTLLEAAQAKDDRTNKLMDVFDEATIRGIGQNQRLLDDISGKVNKLDVERAMAPAPVGSSGSVPDRTATASALNSALNFVKFLGADSESILESFGTTDRLLNNADYDVSVTEAKMAHSSTEVFRLLEEEKKKEDGKIEEDLSSRMSSVRSSHKAIMMNIEEALEVVEPESATSAFGDTRNASADEDSDAYASSTPGVCGTTGSESGTGSKTPDYEQQERLRKALDEAKKRNASRVVYS